MRNLTIDWFRRRDGRHRLPALAENLPPIQRRIFELVFLENRSHIEAFEQIRTRDASTMTFRMFQAELRAVYQATTKGRRGVILPEMAPAVPVAESEKADSGFEDGSEEATLLERELAILAPEDRVTVELFVIERPDRPK